MDTSTAIIVLVIMLAGNAFFVAGEFSMVSARRDQLEPKAVEGSTGAKYALRGIENVSTSLAATQLGITACSLIIGAVGEPAIASLLEAPMTAMGLPASLSHLIALIIALVFVTFLHMVLGEMVPKNIAIAGPARTAQILGPSLHFFVVIARPIIWLMNETANHLVRWMFKAEPRSEVETTFTSAQVQDFVAESGRQGILDNDEIRLLSGALNFEKLTASDVVMPVDSLRTVPESVTAAQVEALCAETGYSRFPVTAPNGKWYGYVHTKDMLSVPASRRDEPVDQELIRKPSEIRDTDKLQKVMRTMQRDQAHFAIVRDGEGTRVGMVALEDVLEELVGEVREATARG